MFRTAYRGLAYLGNAFRGLFYVIGTNPTPTVPDSTLCLAGTGGKTLSLTGGGGKVLSLTGTGGSCR